MKRIVSLILIVLVIICSTITNVYAASCEVNLNIAKTEFDKNEEFVVDVNLSNIQQAGDGIIIFSGTLEYNKSALTLVEINGAGKWGSPSYNESNGKFTMDRNAVNGEFAKSDETMMQIKFRVNDQSVQTSSITIKDIELSDGNEDINVANISKTITVKDGTPNEGENNNQENNNQGNNQDSNNSGDQVPDSVGDSNTDNNQSQGSNQESTGNENTQSPTTIQITNLNQSQSGSSNTKNNDVKNDSPLPYTGRTTTAIMIIITGAVILALIFYVRIRMIDKKANNKNNE